MKRRFARRSKKLASETGPDEGGTEVSMEGGAQPTPDRPPPGTTGWESSGSGTGPMLVEGWSSPKGPTGSEAAEAAGKAPGGSPGGWSDIGNNVYSDVSSKGN